MYIHVTQVNMSDGKWLENTDEFLEVFLVLSDYTFETLIEEVVSDVKKLSIIRQGLKQELY